MFTGIITAIGRVRSARREGPLLRAELECAYTDVRAGESIAVDGVCLTALADSAGSFAAQLSAETLSRTTLGELAPGKKVNLERALAVGDRLGGHLVSGHVDAVGRVLAREPVGDAERWLFEAPAELLALVAVKGSITVDGVSLTVNEVTPTAFGVTLVPFTLGHTTLGDKRAGSPVNLEADVLARYVARALEVRGQGGVTPELLARAGFL